MAFNKDQNEPKLPISKLEKRETANLLPRFYRTKSNKKFLQASLDQLTQPGTVKKLNGFIGRESAKAVTSSDIFLEAASKDRQDYQLEPAAVITDYLGNTTFFKDYIDHINHVKTFDGNVKNHSRLNKEEFYSWNPHICWDKFVNYQQYYWLPFGPSAIEVFGQQLEVKSTFTVKGVDEEDNVAYLFTPNGLSRNPTLRLFRGQTYTFDIDAKGHPFSIKTARVAGDSERYTTGVDLSAVEKGKITFTVPVNSPDVLFYVSENDVNTGGVFHVLNIEENTEINIATDFIGKQEYIVPNGTAKGLVISNGMKLSFGGQVTPAEYAEGFWYVEGVGTAITLVKEKDLEIRASYKEESEVLFDDTPFDQLPFGDVSLIPNRKDYIVINRASVDKNPWTRYNRWFHKDVIVASATANGAEADLDQSARAVRPIIEFIASTKLHNYGHKAKQDIDVIDNFTTDVFSTIEGRLGYNVDGIDLADGMRVLFTADPDSFVKNRIFKVNFIEVIPPTRTISFDGSTGINLIDNRIVFEVEHGLTSGNRITYLTLDNPVIPGLVNRQIYYTKVIDTKTIELYTNFALTNRVQVLGFSSGEHRFEVYSGLGRQINLVEEPDATPTLYETVSVNYGKNENLGRIIGNQGQAYWFNGTTWKLCQAKFTVNQPPLFDVFDENGHSYADTSIYDGSTFTGTKIFSYKVGTSTDDTELGFPLTYLNINNIGDILFEFNLLKDQFAYKETVNVIYKNTDVGFLKKIRNLDDCYFENAWTISAIENSQPVVRVFKESGLVNNFPVDVFDDVNNLEDLEVRVYLNGKRLDKNSYIIETGVVRKFVKLDVDVATTDVITLRCFATQSKNNNGYYEIPGSLQNNPLNNNIDQFTLGQVIDHVDSIIDNISVFDGIYPGTGNLRDLGNLTAYGTKFVQHSGSINLSLYHLGSKSANIVKAMDQARNDYGNFKRAFIVAATESGIDTDPKRHLDFILQKMALNKPKTSPYFLSDMFGYTASNRIPYTILDARIKTYPLTQQFNLDTLSNRSVNIYLNGEQLLHGRDYVFGNDVFFELLVDLAEDDLLESYEYGTTDGCFCPPTPTKLGLYPLFEPKIYLDDTYVEPTNVIQGHDGSITVAFGDYRDELILELEKRIFNNIKVKYNVDLFDIFNFIPGYERTVDYSRQEFDRIMSKYFFQWTLNIQQDYTKHLGYNRENPFTYNYRGSYTPDGIKSPASWRGIYRWLFDTERPHLHPWECLGFSIEPRWWQSVYGPAPYTSDNLILWEDIKQGIIREPGVPLRRNEKFAKSILNVAYPVDQEGKLVAPYGSEFISGSVILGNEGYFTFGDNAPVENAWRSSSYYPFALLETCLLMKPNDVLGRCIDRSRVVRNSNNQLVYSDTGLRLRLEDLVLPSTVNDDSRVYTAGLINYIVDYLTSENVAMIDQYSTDLKSLTNNVSTRLGSFTNQPKYKILLDSKSPNSSGGVFVPEENYSINLNVSSAIEKVVYSGVLVTKFPDGFEIRGYNFDDPYFNYYGYRQTDRVIRVGGISESYTEWTPSRTYVAGKIVKSNNQFYRVKTTHTSGGVFDNDLYARLSELPIVGGREAELRKAWDLEDNKTLAYGTRLPTIQDVVDFLQGYGVYLENLGFVFDDFTNSLSTIANWETSIKEFLFWTTQNWGEGSVIALSPCANRLIFRSDLSVVENVTDQFYNYSIFRVDGQKLEPELLTVYRTAGEFTLEPEGTTHGIFGATLFLVQKEHVAVLNNTTLFNDTIYDPETGYKQERVKILGYVSSNWTGGFEIPGFVYDQAVISAWEQWTDYNLGDIVKYKEFYYSATKFLVGTELFDSNHWALLEEKPKSALLPNLDYKAEQFTDFYDLDTDNLDSNQQAVAQHLIGYQKRQYLENIIKNDVSQYKFYQGMIIEKGTQNSLNKLFDVLSADDQESLTFDEEWAFRVGEYGAVDSFEEVEFSLDESQFKVNPQPIELVDNIDSGINDFVYRQRPADVYIKPFDYANDIWPLDGNKTNFLRTPGYVRSDTVKLSVDSLENLTTTDISSFVEGDYIWCAFEGRDWNVYRLSNSDVKIINVTYQSGVATVTCDKMLDIAVGSFVGIKNTEKLNGFHKVASVTLNKFTFNKTLVGFEDFTEEDKKSILLFEVTDNRVPNIDDANSVIPKNIKVGELVWADNDGTDKWAVYENTGVFRQGTVPNTDPRINTQFGIAVAITENGNIAAVTDVNGVTILEKGSADNAWRSTSRIYKPTTYIDDDFGSALKFSRNSEWFAISSPMADDGRGYLTMYQQTPSENYIPVDTIASPDPEDDEQFGYSVAFGKITKPSEFYGAVTGIYAGPGISATWNIIRTGTAYTVSVLDKGFRYRVGDSIKVSGLRVGGTTPENDIVISITSVDAQTGAITSFGHDGVAFNDASLMAVAAKGTGKVYVFKYLQATGWTHLSSSPLTITDSAAAEFGHDLIMSADASTLVVSAPNDNNGSGRVYVYSYEYDTEEYSLAQDPLEADSPDDAERFGESVAVTSSGKYIAVGSTLIDVDSKFDVGQVFVYENTTTYDLVQVIDSPRKEVNERYGADIEFMNNDETLVVFSANGDSQLITTFDDSSTYFDSSTVRFVQLTLDAGRIDIFDRYNNKFIFGESLPTASLPLSGYGKELAVGRNTIVTSAVNETNNGYTYSGKLYSYVKIPNTYSWSKLYTEVDRVDVSKIKKAYLYNKASTDLLLYLDIVDPVQGKIPGPADQEIKYKTYFDPAVYSVGTEEVNVDAGMNWTKNQVGMLWWDLTRAKFLDSHGGDAVSRTAIWNKLYDTASVDVYEWVETTLTPAQWNKLADTEKGLPAGISGLSKYGDEIYSVNKKYDTVSKTFKDTYYFWVKNKTVIPNVEGRSLSSVNVANLIADPIGYGYPCLAFIGSNSFALVNVKSYLEDTNTALNVQYWVTENKDNNLHSEWKLLSTNRNTVIPTALETKWFDSIVGKDLNDRVVPDINLPLKQRYGIEFRPRQGMFVNRIEATKQLIERVNSVIKTKLIVDDYDLSELSTFEAEPSAISGSWDTTVDTDAELRFVTTSLIRKAILKPVIVDGRVTGITIVDSGAGYGKLRTYAVNEVNDPILWYGPSVELQSTGSAKIATVINSQGQIVDTIIQDAGEGYDTNVLALVRNFTVLVKSDVQALGNWSLYTWNYTTKEWDRIRCQSFDVRKYWKYIDWYADGYNQFVKIDHLVENTYELVTTVIDVGSIVKVKNVGTGGWLLLEKYNNAVTIDYTENFTVVGRESGSIEFLDNLYRYIDNNVGYDGSLFDSAIFDNTPTIELRIILETIKNKILVDEYRVDYLKLFFASVRYAIHEQLFVDWVFKTSFVKGQHNVGELKQKVTYNSDNLEFFEQYINEVKPYKTKIREYVSDYSNVEVLQSAATDFDLFPVITDTLQVNPLEVYVTSAGEITTTFSEISRYPWKFWSDNLGFEITELVIIDGGAGYATRPAVEITGLQLEGGTPAVAKAYIANGIINRIELVTPGTKWLRAPTVKINGGLFEGGREAKVVAIIGNSVPRSAHLRIKFDRISKTYEIEELTQVESGSTNPLFIGNGSKAEFALRWAPDFKVGNSFVTIDGIEVLDGNYSLTTVTSTSKGYTSHSGLLTFKTAPAKDSVVLIEYNKDFAHLSATDRIKFYYNPTTGQLGKDYGQLMTGVDYGGVSITGIDFEISSGWDALPWFSDAWDSGDPSIDDFLVSVSSVPETSYRLPYVPARGEKVTVYISKYIISPTASISNAYVISAENRQLGIETSTAHNLVKGQFVTINGVAGLGANYLGFRRVTEIISDTKFVVVLDKPIVLGTGGTVTGSRFEPSVRIDDPNYLTITQTNPNAVMATFVGDGEVDIIVLPEDLNHVENDRIVFRKITSDGSSKIRDVDLDTALTGGTLSYNTATGLAPDDIILDGDDLISANTSYAPEEVVPGHVADTLAIKVYHRPSGGCPNILFNTHRGDGATLSFKIGQYFPNNQSIIVKVDDLIREDYTIDFESNNVIFETAPAIGSAISILSLGFNAESILDVDYFVSDGETKEYLTRAPWLPTASATVLVNGEIPQYELFTTDETYTDVIGQTWRARVGIRFVTAPAQGAIINYIISPTDIETTASIVRVETIVYTDEQTYPLTNLVGVNSPLELNVLVKNNQTLLKPASAEYFVMQNNVLSYALPDHKYLDQTISASDFTVYRDNQLLSRGLDYIVDFDYAETSYTFTDKTISIIDGGTGYTLFDELTVVGGTLVENGSPATLQIRSITLGGAVKTVEIIYPGDYLEMPELPFTVTGGTGADAVFEGDTTIVSDPTNITVNLNFGAYTDGSKLTVLMTKDADYTINDDNSITFAQTYAEDAEFEIISFYNHNVLGIERTTDRLAQTVTLTPGTTDYYTLIGKLGGRFRLANPAVSGNFVWVIKNGEFLMNNVNYYLETDMVTIKLTAPLIVGDEVQIIAFTNTVVHDSFAYMQFKDMLNRVHYKRLNRSKATTLDRDLAQFDNTITVVDGDRLDRPNPSKNLPGIIEINGERIEYFVKDGNVLGQLRRGTLGTGMPSVHSKGQLVQCIGSSETIPYKDEQIIKAIISDGVTNTIPLAYVPTTQDIRDETIVVDVEVFVGGLRLKKSDYEIYAKQLSSGQLVNPDYPTSPEGDITLPAEFTTTGSAELTLTNVPPLGTKIIIVKKQGKLWNDTGKRLAKSTNPVARFLTEVGADWPETSLDKYENRVLDVNGTPLQAGDGNPLEY